MNKRIDKKLRVITRKIVSGFHPEKIILFGSYAWGHPGPDSDLDLLVIKESSVSRREREQAVRTLLWPAGIPMDILAYTPAELEKAINEDHNLFLEDAVRNGKALFIRPGAHNLPLPLRPLALVQ